MGDDDKNEMDRKNARGKDKKEDVDDKKDPADDENEDGVEEKEEAQPKPEAPAQEAKDFLKDVVEQQEEKVEMMDRDRVEKREFTPIHIMPSIQFSIGNLDSYLHYEYRQIRPIIRYAIELLIIFLLFMTLPMILLLSISPKSFLDVFRGIISIPNSELDSFFKISLFVVVSYSIFILSGFFMKNLLYSIVFILSLLEVNIEGRLAIILQIICSSTNNLGNAIAAGLIFLLANSLYGPYEFLKETLDFHHLILTLIFWYACFTFVLFVENLVMNIFFGEIGRESFRGRIFDANCKTFIFKKLLAIGEKREAGEDEMNKIIDGMKNQFDSSIFLKHNDLRLSSPDAANEIVESIFAYFEIEEMEYDSIKRFFPENCDEVYRYLSKGVESEEKPPILKKTILDQAIALYKERMDIIQSLADRDKILSRLNIILLIAVGFISIIILLFLLNVNYKIYLASVGPFLFAFGWIFQDSIKEIYRCFVFLLVSHPFDNGDRVAIDGKEYVVIEIDLIYTTFLNTNGRIVYMPNLVLFVKNIENIRRSFIESEDIEIKIGKNTPFSSVLSLRDNLMEKLKKKEKDFTGEVAIKSYECVDQEIVLTLNVQHNSNFQEMLPRYTRRESFIEALESELKAASISFTHSYVCKT